MRVIGWVVSAWLIVAGGAVWWLTWKTIEAAWPEHAILAITSGMMGSVMGALVFALAEDVARDP